MANKEDEIGALWESTTKEGKVYLKGKIDGREVVLWRNEWKKEGERTPDWRVYKSQPRDAQAAPQATQPTNQQPKPQATQEAVYAPHNAEDDFDF
jgi:uncharacterized protein (DUF736 family)